MKMDQVVLQPPSPSEHAFEFYGHERDEEVVEGAHDDAEVVFLDVQQTERKMTASELLMVEEKMHKMASDRHSRKQNRTTTEALFGKNHFLSSASEDEEHADVDGQSGSGKRGREMANRRAKIKGVASLAAMHSSVNNGRRNQDGSGSRLPLYG